MPAACPVCEQPDVHVFFSLPGVPTLCNVPCATREKALAVPKGDIDLAFCAGCGHIFNLTFRPELMQYDVAYENSLHYSAVFDQYIRSLARDLIERLQLRDKVIIEIGCGKGDFLSLLCREGRNQGVGFDPSFDPQRSAGATPGVTFIPDLFSESYQSLECDLLCCRQVLEHLPEPLPFLKQIRRALGPNLQTHVFFEVPNALYSLRRNGVWDILYEHVSYFWWGPLQRAFRGAGFAVRRMKESFGGQYLCLEATPLAPASAAAAAASSEDAEEVGRTRDDIAVFSTTFRRVVEHAAMVLDGVGAHNQRAVVWGAGTKGVMFSNILKARRHIEFAIDINPHKHGKYMPGCGTAIVAPGFLTDYRPDVVFLMNPLYQTEVEAILAELSVRTKVVPV